MRIGDLLGRRGLLIDRIHGWIRHRQEPQHVAEEPVDQEGPQRREEVASEQRREVWRAKRLGAENRAAKRDFGERRTVVVVVGGAVAADE